MCQLSDKALLESYVKAKNLNLEEEFIKQLKAEIKRRNLLQTKQ